MVMTVNLRKKLIRLHTARRRKRAVGLVREAAAKLSKSKIESVRIGRDLNEFLAKNASGASFLWARLKLNIEKSEGKVEVKLYTTKSEPVSAAAPKVGEKSAKPAESKKAEKQA